MKSLPLLFLLALPAFTQSPTLSIDLSGDWRIQEEDRPEFSKPDFDDRAWGVERLPLKPPPFTLTRRGDRRPVGYWWLRRTVELPEWADVSQLAITLGGMNEVYEVFVNGNHIASAGEPRLSKTYIARPRTFAIPRDTVLANRRLTIAMRHWRSGFVSSAARGVVAFPDVGPYLLTYQSNAPADAAASQMARRERRAIPLLIVAEFGIVLAVLLLFGWAIQRDRQDLALLAGVLLSQSLLKIYDYVSIVADWPHRTNLVGAMGLTLTPLFLARFAEHVLRIRAPWLSRAAWGVLAVHAFVNLMAFWNDTLIWRPLDFIWVEAGIAIVLGCIFFAAVQALWQTIHEGKRAEAIVPFAIAMIAFLLTQNTNSPWRVLRTVYDSYGMRWSLVDLLMLAAGLAVTLHLIRGLGAARQRLVGEMEAARAVQQLLLADQTSRPDAPFRIDTAYVPAQEVGGDFYKTLDRADGSQVIIIGDVSGKGLPAAMLVSTVIGALGREISSSPAAILTGLNEAISGHTGGGFVTCCAVRLALDEVIIANAGHIPPYLNGRELELEPGLPLGMMRDVSYAEVRLSNTSGQMTLVSDGVVEAANAKGELFGFDRTCEISGKSAAEIAEAAKAWGQNDDITVVTVRRNG